MLFRFKRFQSRLMVFFLGLLSVVLGAVFFSVTNRNLENAMDIIVNDLETGARNFEFTIAQRNESLAISADALSADFAFKQVYASADFSTILSAMDNLLDRMVYADFMVLVSENNQIIADTHDPDNRGEIPTWLPLIELARQRDRDGEYPEAEDVQIINNRPYHLTVLPFLNPDIEAWIGMGFEIDQIFTSEFKNSISAEVSVIYLGDDGSWQSNGSTLPLIRVQELLAGFTGELSPGNAPGRISLGNEEYVTLTMPIMSEGNSVQVLLQRSLSVQLQPYDALQYALLTIFTIGLGVLIAGVTIISRNVTRPVTRLVSGAKRIEEGDYEQLVEIDQEDEIGELAAAFNQMARGLAEKEKVRDLLGKVVSPQIADELLSKKLELGGEECEVTVLFSDIRGFTSLCEGKSPKQLLALLNEYFTALTGVIEANGGVVDKYIGDAIMALFGAPISHSDDASRAVRTALGMQAALSTVNREFAHRGSAEIHIGVGINTDRVVVGNMGTPTRLNYTVIGDGVNLASRLEGLTRNYGAMIIVSESTRDAAGDFIYQELDKVTVKGKTQAVKIFRPIIAKADADAKLLERLALFHQILEFYQCGNFLDAKARLEEYRGLNPGEDTILLELYNSRIEQFIKTPPADWDGITIYENK